MAYGGGTAYVMVLLCVVSSCSNENAVIVTITITIFTHTTHNMHKCQGSQKNCTRTVMVGWIIMRLILIFFILLRS